MANQMEEDSNDELNKFDNVNDEMNGTVGNIEEQCDIDVMPRRMFGVVSIKELKKEKVDTLTFS